MKKTEWIAETTLTKIMNNVKVVDGKTIACVMFHNRPWKVVAHGTDFATVADRAYEPIAEFRTREELWKHLKTV